MSNHIDALLLCIESLATASLLSVGNVGRSGSIVRFN